MNFFVYFEETLNESRFLEDSGRPFKIKNGKYGIVEVSTSKIALWTVSV